MDSLQPLHDGAERLLRSLDGTIPAEYVDRVRTTIRDAIPRLVEQHRQNGIPTHQLLRDMFTGSFPEIDAKDRYYLTLVLRDVGGRILDIMNREKPIRSIVGDLGRETAAALEKVDEIGKGISIFGSARTKPGDEDYNNTRELARELTMLLHTPIWTGAGPGQMEAALAGAVEANGRIGGIKIDLPNSFEQDVCELLGKSGYTLHKRFSGRKIGLLYAATRERLSEKTGIIVTPGGVGTLDETFEEWVLLQTKKTGSKWRSPFIIANYGGYYDDLLQWLRTKVIDKGYVSDKELDLVCVCRSNREILDEFADFYNIPGEGRTYTQRVSRFDGKQHDLFQDIPSTSVYGRRGISWLTPMEQ
jgi:uncharacterized protein (TIGR00730 family)